MRARLIYPLAIVATLALFTSAGLSQQRGESKKLPNFHEVNGKLYRGAQPAAGGVQQLASLGIKTIVNLRGQGEVVRKEEAEARAAGLRFFSIPFDRWDDLTTLRSNKSYPLSRLLNTSRCLFTANKGRPDRNGNRNLPHHS